SKTPQIIKTAWNSEGIIMGVELDGFPVYGVQFHPESFMTEYGELLIINFLKSLHI
ncbi:MAG: aminodeoxychorismate/anthranilate synthase component II, partial [Desulfamplus sp.]|nr:aminodeoxychorismate/anthranilate synthase component II [Desulfamplus sp.]